MAVHNAVSITLSNSIIDNYDEDVIDFSGVGFSTLTNCLIVNEDISIAGFPLNGMPVGYKNIAENDFRLSAQSLARDFCNTAGGSTLDADNEIRGWDDPTTTNMAGNFDAGADESYFGDVIFANNFE
ncbi:MAG: hypothetical protein L3K26_16685 [Candidatus Hydrogenedentes bacterium]|nr:hypothetical protein [Candidatus Hydrogenedentota bacterium]